MLLLVAMIIYLKAWSTDAGLFEGIKKLHVYKHERSYIIQHNSKVQGWAVLKCKFSDNAKKALHFT